MASRDWRDAGSLSGLVTRSGVCNEQEVLRKDGDHGLG